ncbi:uncharacterized protein [Temnothorax nylanderi]|uniref:uncharacterized protein n=1 Tax=Temnothorax nylanderi TaxID=102681 RepID=UPI003A86330C
MADHCSPEVFGMGASSVSPAHRSSLLTADQDPRVHKMADRHSPEVFTGHGCFGGYLCRIGKEAATNCHHCDEVRDTAQHTVCPAWAEQRRVLQREVGNDLSLPAIVAVMVENKTKWRAFLAFCGQVMSAKEEAERIRRGERNPDAAGPSQ